MQTSTQALQREYVLPSAFPVVDAALLEYLDIQIERDPHAPHFKRSRATTGSVRYALRNAGNTDSVEFADITVRAIDDHKTYIAIAMKPLADVAPPDVRAYLDGFCKLQLIAFISWLWADQAHLATLTTPTPTNTLIAVDEAGRPRVAGGIFPAAVNEALRAVSSYHPLVLGA